MNLREKPVVFFHLLDVFIKALISFSSYIVLFMFCHQRRRDFPAEIYEVSRVNKW